MDEKWLKTMEIFDHYEKRIAEARLKKMLSHPWKKVQRENIISSAKRMLGYDESLVPQVHNMKEISQIKYNGYQAIQLRYETWENVYGASTLFLPEVDGKLPLVFVCCGHGKDGRLTSAYQKMGHRIASLGMACLVMDNIGRGDRKLTDSNADHWSTTAPFQCGLTLQGLIVMETIAMIRYMKTDNKFDSSRFGACGNSGGGTLTMFLAALAPELSVISSSGYPSEICYLLQKERMHCACNLLLGQAFEAEMWEIFSVFAPKPLLLEGGEQDKLIPLDLAYRNARKVKNTYVQLNAENEFVFALTKTEHSWELDDINIISRFLSEKLLGKIPPDALEIVENEDISSMRVSIPEHSLSTVSLCELLCNKKLDENVELKDIFVPKFKGQAICEHDIQLDIGRGNLMRVFAQLECMLYDFNRKGEKGNSQKN